MKMFNTLFCKHDFRRASRAKCVGHTKLGFERASVTLMCSKCGKVKNKEFVGRNMIQYLNNELRFARKEVVTHLK